MNNYDLDRHRKQMARQKIKDLMNFDSELSSAACCSSPLTTKEVETLQRRFKSINLLLTKVAKREAKKRKK